MGRSISIEILNRRLDKRGVYVGRPTPLGNPYRLDREEDRPLVVAQYRKWLEDAVRKDPRVRAAIDELKRKAKREGRLALSCWCAPKLCHAEVVAELVGTELEKEGWTVEIKVAGRGMHIPLDFS